MEHVIDHFTSNGRKLGVFVDGGLDPKQIRDLLTSRDDEEASEYDRLHRRLDGLFADNQIEYHPVDENGSPFTFQLPGGQIDLIPMAPEPRIIRSLQRIAVRSGRITQSLNAISVVIAIRITGIGLDFNGLLAADAEATIDVGHPTGLGRAIGLWQEKCRVDSRPPRFDILKVPHHGSIDGFLPELAKMRGDAGSIAIVSVGTKYSTHPDRRVLKEYLDNGWTIISTCKRTKPVYPDSPLDLFAKNVTEREHTFQRQTLVINCENSPRISWMPEEAAIKATELDFYGTARTAN